MERYADACPHPMQPCGLIARLDPIDTPEDYECLQTALKEREDGRRVNASRLLQVAYCALCSSPLHTTPTRTSADAEQVYRYYLCSGGRKRACPANRVPAAYLEDLAGRLFLGLVGNQEILERIYIPAEDSSAELTAVEQAMEHLEAQYAADAACCGETGAARFPGMMTRLEERRDRLAALPSTPARIEYRPTGQTFADQWREEDQAGRRQLMVHAGFQVRITRTPIAPAAIWRSSMAAGTMAQARTMRRPRSVRMARRKP
jgi:site-specific DNA recombinase